MAPFRLGIDELQHPLPWRLLQNGAVTKCWRREYFAEDISELSDLGFRIARFDVATWHDDVPAMRDALRDELGMPSYTGGSFNAMADSLTDIEVPDDGGLVVALDNFTASDSNEGLLEVLAAASRWWLLLGRLVIVLLRTDDGQYEGPTNLAATAAWWNCREWLNAKRLSKDRTSRESPSDRDANGTRRAG